MSPAADKKNTYRTQLKVRFGDEDHAQVVYFPRFFDFFHRALEDFFGDNGLSYRTLIDKHRVGFPAVHAEADFQQPLRFGDVLDIEVWVERIGEKSVTFAFVGTRLGDGAPIARCRLVSACIDMETFRAQAVPEVCRAFLSRFVPVD